MKVLRFLVVAGLSSFFATSALASTIPLPPLTTLPVAGQSNINSLTCPFFGCSDTLNIDWMVLPGSYVSGVTDLPTAFGTDGTDFVYMYQVENDTGFPVSPDIMSISQWDTTTYGPAFAGYIPGVDLDLASVFNPAHDPATFLNLAGESEPVGFPPPLLAVIGTVDPTGVTWQWQSGLLMPGFESDGIFFFITKQPPAYGFAGLQDTVVPPTPWQSVSPGGQMVPIPAAEPGTLLFLGLGLAALGLRSRNKS